MHNIDRTKYDTIYLLEWSNAVSIVTEHRESPLSTSITLAYNVTSAAANNEIYKWLWICHIHKYDDYDDDRFSDVIMGVMAFQITKSPALPLFIKPFVEAQIKENIKAPRHWPLCGEFTSDQ